MSPLASKMSNYKSPYRKTNFYTTVKNKRSENYKNSWINLQKLNDIIISKRNRGLEDSES
jgi:hypothetical protein